MKKFITVISLQTRDLLPLKYIPDDNVKLSVRREVSFPILLAIDNFAEKGEQIEIVPVIIYNSESSDRNYEIFQKELAEIADNKGFTYVMNPVRKDISDNIEINIKLFSDLIGKVNDNDELYACITFGTKPISVVTMMALNYAYKVKENIDVSLIMYGSGKWDGNKLYDVTPMFYIDSAVNHLAKMKLQKPENALRVLLGIDTEG